MTAVDTEKLRDLVAEATPVDGFINRHMQVSVPLEDFIALLDEIERLRLDLVRWKAIDVTVTRERDALKQQLAAMTAALESAQTALYDAMHAGHLSREYHDGVIVKVESALSKVGAP